MTRLTFKQLSTVTNDYDLFLFDLWGVIVENGEVYPGVIDLVNKTIEEKDVLFVSNAPKPAQIVAKNLGNWGMKNVTEDMVITSGDVARQIISDTRLSSLGGRAPVIYHLGSDRNDDILFEMHHEITNDLSEADILLLSIYRDDHEDIEEFNDLLKQAAQIPNLPIICSNPDTTIPKHGAIRYCAGYFAGIIEKFGGQIIYTGKPKSSIYDAVFQKKQSIKKDRILMVGDTFETDIIGASNAAIHSALVLSGNSVPFHNMYDSIDDKLVALFTRGKEIGIMPTFVTETTSKNGD